MKFQKIFHYSDAIFDQCVVGLSWLVARKWIQHRPKRSMFAPPFKELYSIRVTRSEVERGRKSNKRC